MHDLPVYQRNAIPMHGLPVHEKDRVPFARDSFFQNSGDSYFCLRLAFLCPVSYFFYISIFYILSISILFLVHGFLFCFVKDRQGSNS